MLRPAKLFSSLHQLRHFLHAKVTELVQPHALQNRLLIQATQVMIQPQWHANAPMLYRVAELQQQRLLQVLQEQFPIVKVFSSPTITRPWPMSQAPLTALQYRTAMSSSCAGTEAGGLFGASSFFHRPHMVGYRAASRQFSTVRSPCVHFFQQANNAGGHHGLMHVYPRLFSPASSKMAVATQPTKVAEKPVTLSPTSTAKENSTDDDSSALRSVSFDVPYARRTLSTLCQTTPVSQSVRDAKRKRTEPTQSRFYDYLRHDDLSIVCAPVSKPRITTTSENRQRSRPKAPADQDPVVYLVLTLEMSPLSRVSAGTGGATPKVLDEQWIHNAIVATEDYQSRIQAILAILRRLQTCGEFHIEVREGELHVLFSPTLFEPHSPSIQAARQWLADVGVDPDSTLFTLHLGHPSSPTSATPKDHSRSSAGHKEAPERQTTLDSMATDDSERALSMQSVDSEYFEEIHSFLDYIDELLETRPTFKRRRQYE